MGLQLRNIIRFPSDEEGTLSILGLREMQGSKGPPYPLFVPTACEQQCSPHRTIIVCDVRTSSLLRRYGVGLKREAAGGRQYEACHGTKLHMRYLSITTVRELIGRARIASYVVRVRDALTMIGTSLELLKDAIQLSIPLFLPQSIPMNAFIACLWSRFS